jgi:hypothetical protein
VTECFGSGCELARQLALEQGDSTGRVGWMEEVVPAQP